MRGRDRSESALASRAERRLGEDSPRPLASLSVMLKIEAAQVRIRTESSVTNAREATVGTPSHTQHNEPTERTIQ